MKNISIQIQAEQGKKVSKEGAYTIRD